MDSHSLWDLSQPSTFSQLPDDDFLALLQKQFPGPGVDPTSFSDSINPQSITPYALPSLSPPSDESSPSPSHEYDPNTMGQSDFLSGDNDDHEPALKRKKSDEDFDEGPNSKNQHTSGSANKKASMRRKSGSGGPDESRLLKRKEQNRAAQRAFRERKEKHVKDLEDKVAALQAQNDQAHSENENLRDLLSRLQNENVVLKNSPFTFSVPKQTNVEPAVTSVSSASHEPSANNFGSTPRASTLGHSADSSNVSSPIVTQTDTIDWNSLTAFDPSVLKLLDESPQHTATDGAMNMDFGFGGSNASSNIPYTTLTSNQFMTYADGFDSPPLMSNGTPAISPFNFDMTSWPTPVPQQQDNNARPVESGLLDELFGTQYMDLGPPVDVSILQRSSPSMLSPVVHASVTSTSSNVSSPASNLSLFNTPRDSTASDEDHSEGTCPKTRDELARRIASEGASPFAPAPSSPKPAVRKASDALLKSIVMCEGSSFPTTEKSDQNVEVLSAWRSITSNPKFKDFDVNELCSEFSKKARCDGTKVVLEPQGVHSILETLGAKAH